MKQRHYFTDKGPSSQIYGFSSSHMCVWELDHKKAECQRIDAFELWCWRRLLRVPWTARRSKQSILKEISPECSLEGLMLKLKFQYFGHLMWRTDSLEKTLMLGTIDGGRRRGRQRRRWLDGITDTMDMSLSKLWEWWWTGGLACYNPWDRKESDMTEQLNWTDWTEQMQETQVRSLIQEDPTCLKATKPVNHNHYICSGARKPKLLKPTHPWAHAPQRERPTLCNCSPLEKILRSTAKNNFFNG